MVMPAQPDRPVADHGVELGGGRIAAEAPFLLVPAEAGDPARRAMRSGVSGELGLRLGEAVRVAEVELERTDAEIHDMAVGVDQPRYRGPALGIEAKAGAFRLLLALLVKLLDAAVIAHPHRDEADQPAFRADRVAVDIVDQDIGRGGSRQQQGGRGRKELFDCHERGIGPVDLARQRRAGVGHVCADRAHLSC